MLHYVVTSNVTNRLQLLRSKAFRVPSRLHPVFRDFQSRFLQEVAHALPGVTLRSIDMRDMMARMRETIVREVPRRNGHVIVTTCFDMTAAVNGRALSVNRLYDRSGRFIGYGPRPGSPPLAEQFGLLAKDLSHKKIILIEDGVFSGSMLTFVLGELASRDLRVCKIIVGFCRPQVRSLLAQAFDGEVIALDEIDMVDWIPDHDLVPFIPHCGRVIGERTDRGLMPVRTSDGASCALPYILPFGKFEDWASLPAAGALGLSRFCLEASIELFRCIARRNRLEDLTVRELVSRCPHISVPILAEPNAEAPEPDWNVVRYLSGLRESLA